MADTPATAYVTTDELKTFLGIASEEKDTLLADVIQNGTDLVNIELWDSLFEQTLTRRVDGIGWSVILMENIVKEVSEIKYRIGTDSWQTLTVDFIDKNKIHLTTKVPNGISNVSVTYKKWYATIPSDFKKFFLFYCKVLMDNEEAQSPTNQNSKEIKQKSLESLSITYFSPSELSSKNSAFSIDYDKILRKYKNFSCYLA